MKKLFGQALRNLKNKSKEDKNLPYDPSNAEFEQIARKIGADVLSGKNDKKPDLTGISFKDTFAGHKMPPIMADQEDGDEEEDMSFESFMKKHAPQDMSRDAKEALKQQYIAEILKRKK